MIDRSSIKEAHMASISPRTPTAERTRRETLEHLLERQQVALEVGRHGLRESGRAESSEVRDAEEECVDAMRLGVNVTVLELRARAACGMEAALWRLNAGTFGRCADCGARIAARRIAAVSFAERCRGCEETYDLVTSQH
jgi:RNA polymerase-binding transcription factor DksA